MGWIVTETHIGIGIYGTAHLIKHILGGKEHLKTIVLKEIKFINMQQYSTEKIYTTMKSYFQKVQSLSATTFVHLDGFLCSI